MDSIAINKTILNFNKVWYVDDANGNDTTGDGSIQKPYKTGDTAYSKMTSGDCIKFAKGSYSITSTAKTYTVIGVPGETIFSYYSYFGSNVNITIIGMITTVTQFQCYYPPQDIAFYNCVLKVSGDTRDNVNVWKGTSSISFINCIMYTESQYEIGFTQLENSGGYYNTKIYSTNCIIDNKIQQYKGSQTPIYVNLLGCISIAHPMQLDSNYNVLPEPSNWKNSGSSNIKNPDGAISSIGVYGGPYAWGDWSTRIDIRVNPTHLYNNMNCTMNIFAINENTNEVKQLKILHEATEISNMSDQNNRIISRDKFNVGPNKISIMADNNAAKIISIVREEPYRTNVERTFLSFDGGYKNKNVRVDGTANLKQLYGISATRDGNKNSVDLDKYITRISKK